MHNTGAPMVIGVSLKMYFDDAATASWCSAVSALASRHEAITSGDVSLFVMPAFTALTTAIDILHGTPVSVGAQDLFWEDRGAFTGEVSGLDLRKLGCSFAEIGHAERRTVLGETPEMVSLKLAAAVRNSLTPVLCIGEPTFGSPDDAAENCVRQLSELLAGAFAAGAADGSSDGTVGDSVGDSVVAATPIIVAYEPEWAIGAPQAASVEHIATVSSRLREFLQESPGFAGSRVIYGGSAGPGLLTDLDGSVDGLFLGRFAHEPSALELVLDEALARR
jgi:triosephosphate isomerase